MAKFEKGHPKYGGRAKGTKNKSNILAKFEEIGFDVVQTIVDSVESQKDEQKAETLIKVLEFIYPKKKNVDFNLISDEELKQVLLQRLGKENIETDSE